MFLTTLTFDMTEDSAFTYAEISAGAYMKNISNLGSNHCPCLITMVMLI